MYVSGNNECNIPCVFALFPNKTRTAYDQFFTNDQWPICNNIQITDAPLAALFYFEPTAISAAKCSSLDADFIECLFLIYHLMYDPCVNICTSCRKDGFTKESVRGTQMTLCSTDMIPVLWKNGGI